MVILCSKMSLKSSHHVTVGNKQTKKAFFFFFPLLKTDQEELPHDGNKDLIILTKERLWCAFRIKTPCTKSAIG